MRLNTWLLIKQKVNRGKTSTIITKLKQPKLRLNMQELSSDTLNRSIGRNNGSSNETHPEVRFLTLPMIVLFAFICLLITAANALVIYLIYKKKTLRTLTNMFLTSLAFSDLISGLVGISLLVICSLAKVFSHCVSSTMFIRFTAISSVCHVLLIASDRYIDIVHPLQHLSLITKCRAIAATFVVWLVSFVAAIIQLSWYGLDETLMKEYQERTEDLDLKYSEACIVLFFAVPLLLMCYMYGRIFYISFKHSKSDRQLSNALQQQARGMRHYAWKGNSVLLIMIVIFVGCWLPYFLTMLRDHAKSSQLSSIPSWVDRLLVVIHFLPPLSNPLLCTLSKHDFRSALKTVVFQRILKRLSIKLRD